MSAEARGDESPTPGAFLFVPATVRILELAQNLACDGAETLVDSSLLIESTLILDDRGLRRGELSLLMGASARLDLIALDPATECLARVLDLVRIADVQRVRAVGRDVQQLIGVHERLGRQGRCGRLHDLNVRLQTLNLGLQPLHLVRRCGVVEGVRLVVELRAQVPRIDRLEMLGVLVSLDDRLEDVRLIQGSPPGRRGSG